MEKNANSFIEKIATMINSDDQLVARYHRLNEEQKREFSVGLKRKFKAYGKNQMRVTLTDVRETFELIERGERYSENLAILEVSPLQAMGFRPQTQDKRGRYKIRT